MAGFRVAMFAAVTLMHHVNASRILKPLFDWDETRYLIAFGDSYTFVQGTAGYPGFSFIGSYLAGDFSLSPEKLLSNKIVQNFTGTANGGPNWIEMLTGCGVETGETSPRSCKTQLWDFAFAGADVSEEFLPLHHDFTIPLVNQTQQYLTWAEPVIGRDMDKSKVLVAIWIGINDVNDSADFGDEALQEFYGRLITAVINQSVGPLYDAGYKNFLFVNLPPLDRTPKNLREERPRPNKTMIGWWNEALKRHSRSLSSANPAVKTMVYDANRFLNEVLDNPDPYGIMDTTSFCPSYAEPEVLTDPGKYGCKPLDKYFWYNSGHMSSQVHKVMVPSLADFLQSESTRRH